MGAYLRPRDLREALGALAAGSAEGRPWVIVAGATDHYPARVGRVADEDVLDVSGLDELRDITETADGWRIGARATWTDLIEAPLPPLFDGIREAARTIGGRQIQNRATIAGNVCNASPAADGMPNLLALDASVELWSAAGNRTLRVAQFVIGNRRTRRRPDELVVGFRVPRSAEVAGTVRRTRSTFLKLGSRAYLVISIAMVAAVVDEDEHGRIARARIAVGACSEVARRLPGLEDALVGQPLRAGIGDIVASGYLAGLSPIDDVRGSAGYRRHAALVLVRRALERLATGETAVAA
jgi:CO/xanthine dehydrogenase FAD-binding subunit